MTQSYKKQMSVVAVIAALTIGVFSVSNSFAAGSMWGIEEADISIDEAAAIAITNLQTESSNLVVMAIEKDGESFIYDLEFEIGDQEVSVEIDPHTGEILEVESEPLEIETDDDDEDNDE